MTMHMVGGWQVTAISDGVFALPPDKLLGLAPEAAEALPASIPLPVRGFLLQGHGRTILVDAGAGGSMGPTLGRLADNLVAAGVQPGQIDTVVLTHIHPDHSNGLLDGAGQARFSRARLLIPQGEQDFWLRPEPDDAPAPMRPYLRAARAAVAEYRDRVDTLGTEVVPGLVPVAMPGHTPGHTGYRLDDGGESLLIWGDVMHVGSIQAAHPEVRLSFDVDADLAEATRRRVLDMAASDRMAVAGMHLDGFSRVEAAGIGYRLTPG